MSEPTPDEKRAHMAGLLKMTARIAARTATLVAAYGLIIDALSKGVDDSDRSAMLDDCRTLLDDANNVRRMLDDIERGVYRGRVNEDVRTAPGALVPSASIAAAVLGATEAPGPLPAPVPKPSAARVHAPTPADYEALGGPPPDWRNTKRGDDADND